jgi:HEAT repeat protein
MLSKCKILFHLSGTILTAALLAGCCDKEALPEAFDQLYSSQAAERNKAALVLARCGERSDKAVPRLSQLLYDENVGVQSSAAYALQEIGTEKAKAALAEAIALREERRQRQADR